MGSDHLFKIGICRRGGDFRQSFDQRVLRLVDVLQRVVEGFGKGFHSVFL